MSKYPSSMHLSQIGGFSENFEKMTLNQSFEAQDKQFL